MATEETKDKPSTAMTPKPLRDTLSSRIPQLMDALPVTLSKEVRQRTAERMVMVALSATGRSATLAKCTHASILKAIMLSAELGLEAGGVLGDAYLVPFKNKYKVNGRWVDVQEATLIIGYKGLIKLARQSGEVASITAQVVYSNDVWEVELGLEPYVKHRPELVKDRGDPLFAYAGIMFKDGGKQLDVMSRHDIERIRLRSRAKDNGPWVTDPAEMWRKTVVRRLMKYAPLSSDRMQRAQAHDDEVDGAINDIIDVDRRMEQGDDTPPPTAEAKSAARSQNLASKIKGQAPPAQQSLGDQGPAYDDFTPDDDQGEAPPAEPSQPAAQAQQPAAKPATPPADPKGLARDGTDGSVPADQEPPDEEEQPPPGAGDAWEPKTKK